MNRYAALIPLALCVAAAGFATAQDDGSERVPMPLTPKELKIQRGLSEIEKECIE